MRSPEELDRQVTLRTAVARFDDLATRHVLGGTEGGALDRPELLELLALGEVIARKAAYGRQLAVRSARAAGASWSEIGRALGATKQAAWEAHTRWIDQQARQHGEPGQLGFDEADAARARAGAGSPD
jgi:hypothetical protein